MKKLGITNLPAVQTVSNPWLDMAQEASSGIGRLLKFTKGVYECGDSEIKIGTEFVAHVDQIARGWIKFTGGKLAEQRLFKGGEQPPPRDALGDNDQSTWDDVDNSGKPRDPWFFQWYLPLSSVDDGDTMTFATQSKGGIGAIGKLCSLYGRRGGRGPLPIIQLGSSSYKNKKYGRIDTPEFPVVRWDDAAAGPVAQIPLSKDIMDDEIPFLGTGHDQKIL